MKHQIARQKARKVKAVMRTIRHTVTWLNQEILFTRFLDFASMLFHDY